MKNRKIPRNIEAKIGELAEPYGNVVREQKVELMPSTLTNLEKILKKLQKKPTRFNATFFSKWNKQVVRFNQKFAAALAQLKTESDLKSLQKLQALIANELPKSALGYSDIAVLEKLEDAIYTFTIQPQEEKMEALVETELKETLAQEFKKHGLTPAYFDLIKQEEIAEQHWRDMTRRLEGYEERAAFTLEEFVQDYNYEVNYDGYGSKLTLYKREISSWVDEADEYENHTCNEDALERYATHQKTMQENVAYYKQEVANALAAFDFARKNREDYDFAKYASPQLARKLLKTEDPWQQVKLFGLNNIEQLICKKLEAQFKLASIKTLTPKETEPSAPPLYPVLTNDREDEYQPGLR